MRKLRGSGLLVAMLVLVAVAAGCGAARPGPATGAASAAAARSPASVLASARAAASVIKAKARGIAVSIKGGGRGKRADLLNGVSCTADRCVAVGAYYPGTTGREQTLVEVRQGGAWQLLRSPSNATDSSLSAVSCAAVDAHGTAGTVSCLAAGSPVISGDAATGASFTSLAASSDLDAVSCPEPGSCMAVGWNTRAPVFASYDGRTGILRTGVLHPPPGKYQEARIDSVSCTSADNCVAVGDYSYGVGARPTSHARDLVLVERWNGRGWQLMPTLNVSRVDSLAAVSCASPTDCTAVGTAVGAQSQFPFAEHWSGTTWTTAQLPTVNPIGYVTPTGVSCPVAGFCVAVGDYQGLPIAETWNGSTWRVSLLPQPPVDNHSAQLTSVSCTSDSACVAIGISGDARGYAEVYAGGRWQLSAMQNPV